MAEWTRDLYDEIQKPQPPPQSESSSTSIYRVPKILGDVNSQAYVPKLASFGPYHRGSPHVLPMEQHKRRALIQFLRRIYKASKTPEHVFYTMRKVEAGLLCAYDALPLMRCSESDKMEMDNFIKLMITDGCFALEVMLAEKRWADGEAGEYSRHDPVFGVERNNYVIPDLKRDMLLIENQLPLLALSTLAGIEGSGIQDLTNLIRAFYNLPSTSGGEQCCHILDLYRKMMTCEGKYLPSYEESVHSAAELRDFGVSFCKSGSKSFRDMSFRGRQLSLPPLEMDDKTESLLLNLMAFESLHPTAGNAVTAYAFFMNRLVSTSDDVALLRRKGIVVGWAGCDDNIAGMFNRITKEVIFRDDIKIDASDELNAYCKKRMRRWRASFIQNYLKSPWVFISLVGGLLLLVLTVLQTVFTILSYYHS